MEKRGGREQTHNGEIYPGHPDSGDHDGNFYNSCSTSCRVLSAQEVTSHFLCRCDSSR